MSERRSRGASRRTLIRAAGAGLLGAAGVALAGCGQAGSGEGSTSPAADGTPQEVLWSNYAPPSDPRSEWWKETWKATGLKIAEVSRVWETGGHDLLVTPDSGDMWPFMMATTAPLKGAFDGVTSTREAMQELARLVNDLFSRRPANWK